MNSSKCFPLIAGLLVLVTLAYINQVSATKAQKFSIGQFGSYVEIVYKDGPSVQAFTEEQLKALKSMAYRIIDNLVEFTQAIALEDSSTTLYARAGATVKLADRIENQFRALAKMGLTAEQWGNFVNGYKIFPQLIKDMDSATPRKQNQRLPIGEVKDDWKSLATIIFNPSIKTDIINADRVNVNGVPLYDIIKDYYIHLNGLDMQDLLFSALNSPLKKLEELSAAY